MSNLRGGIPTDLVAFGVVNVVQLVVENNDLFFSVLAIGAFVLGVAWGVINRKK